MYGMYICMLLIALAFIIVPSIAKKYNSVEASIFLLSLGYSGLSFAHRTNDTRIKIAKKEYLKLAKESQAIFGVVLIIMTSIMYFFKVNQFLFGVIILPISIIGSLLVWKKMKKYKV